MEEDPGPNAPTYLEGPTRKRLAEVSFRQLDGFFKLVPLPRDDELKHWVTLSHWEAKMSRSMRRGPQRGLWDGMHSSPTLSPCEIR